MLMYFFFSTEITCLATRINAKNGHHKVNDKYNNMNDPQKAHPISAHSCNILEV